MNKLALALMATAFISGQATAADYTSGITVDYENDKTCTLGAATESNNGAADITSLQRDIDFATSTCNSPATLTLDSGADGFALLNAASNTTTNPGDLFEDRVEYTAELSWNNAQGVGSAVYATTGQPNTGIVMPAGNSGTIAVDMRNHTKEAAAKDLLVGTFADVVTVTLLPQ